MSRYTFFCPHCGAQLNAPLDWVGKEGDCKSCGRTFVAPQPAVAPAPPPAAPAPVAPPPLSPAPTLAPEAIAMPSPRPSRPALLRLGLTCAAAVLLVAGTWLLWTRHGAGARAGQRAWVATRSARQPGRQGAEAGAGKPFAPATRAAAVEPVPPDVKRLEVDASPEARKLWQQWNGRYVLLVHRANPIRSLGDLAGRELHCAMIETDAIFGDSNELCRAAGVADSCMIALQNNPDYYDKQLLENQNAVGMMVPEVAEHYRFRDNPKLVEVVIR